MAEDDKKSCCPECGKKSYAQGFCHDLQHCHHCGWNYTGNVLMPLEKIGEGISQ